MLVAPDNWLLAQSEIDAVTAHKQGTRTNLTQKVTTLLTTKYE